MAVAFAERLQRPEVEQEQKPFCMFIGGATSQYKGLGGIDHVLKGRFGQDNVRVFNSSLFSPEKPSPTRFKEMGDLLKEKLIKGPVKVIGHSFAVAEVYAAMGEMERDDPDFFEKPEHLANLQIMLISPTLPKNMREGMLTGTRTAKFVVQETGLFGGRTLPGKTATLHGIESTAILPPIGVDYETLGRRVRQAASSISHRARAADDGIAIVDFTPQRNYQEVLTQDEKDIVESADDAFLDALALGDTEQALRRRGRQTHTLLGKINRNDWPNMGDTVMESTNYPKDKESKKMMRKLLYDTFISGKVYDKMTELSEAGASITIVWPEFDIMISQKQMGRLLSTTNISAVVASQTTHGFPWADQPENLLTLLDYIQ